MGILLRIVVYLQNRSLFLDEANLARNIADRSFAGLFAPLDHQQYAPPLFLVLEKLNWLVAGSSEMVLRCWPLIMGCVGLYLVYRLLIDQTGRSVAALIVLWLFSFSQVYIRYATELKQYGTDMAVSALLIWLTIRYPIGKRWYVWPLVGGIAVWLSMPSVFILAGIGIYWLIPYYWRKKPDGHFIRIIITGGIWLLSFGIYYLLILRHDVGRPALIAYHQAHFWPLFPTDEEQWQRLQQLSHSLMSTLCGHTVPALFFGGIGLLSGIRVLWATNKRMILLLLVPVLLCLVASGLGKYSLMERLSLFMMPLLGLLLGIGLHDLWQRAAGWGRGLLVLLFIAVLPLQKGIEYLIYPLQQEEMRPLLIELDKQLAEGDRLWIDHNARPASTWYTQYDRLEIGQIDRANLIFSDWNGVAREEIGGSTFPPGAVWLIFSHLVSDYNRQEMEQDMNAMKAAYGPYEKEIRYRGVAAFKYRLK
ncbi:MAG: glycosyltransferase family 39 protein [Saprospiraceae bacterium]|nr:glycosyltransferase family 39 protein [Lewinella sp.]